MDMNISMRDKKILLMFLGVGVFAAGYFFGYRPQMEEAQSIQASTEPLKTRLDDLLKLAADRDFYLKETEDINAKVSEYTSAFPADIRPEDGIVLSMNMENFLDMQISNVGLGTREFVASWTEVQKTPWQVCLTRLSQSRQMSRPSLSLMRSRAQM